MRAAEARILPAWVKPLPSFIQGDRWCFDVMNHLRKTGKKKPREEVMSKVDVDPLGTYV